MTKISFCLALTLTSFSPGCSPAVEPSDETTTPCPAEDSDCNRSCVEGADGSEDCGAPTCVGAGCAEDTGTGGTGVDVPVPGEDGSGGAGSTEVLFEEGELGQCDVDGELESTHPGFTGAGYLNTDNVTGASIEWALNVGAPGTYSLEFTYASESGDRPADVLVDRQELMGGLSFPATSSWTTWSTTSISAELSAGENLISLSATSAAGLANIDSLKVTGAEVSALDCDTLTTPEVPRDDPPPCATNQIDICENEGNDIACHFGGDPGDYLVTVELGGQSAGDMVVDAEMLRRMIGETKTEPGETRRFAFTTNVRVYEGQPVNPDQKGSSTGIPGLDVYIRGAAPQLTAICMEPVNPKPKLWIAGDSTVCDQETPTYSGWGQHIPQYFDSSVSVSNYADSGESTGSFLASPKLWNTVKSGWKSGDWVLIQLGHNDKNATATTFKNNLTTMITQAKADGVHPILATPISRAGTELEWQHINSTGANLPQIIRDLGVEHSVPVLDLTVLTHQWLQTIDWKMYFALGTDKTHPNYEGASIVAGIVADAIGAQDIELADHLR